MNIRQLAFGFSLYVIFMIAVHCGQDKPARNVPVPTPAVPAEPAPAAPATAAPIEEKKAPTPEITAEPKSTTAPQKPVQPPPGLVAYATRETAVLYEKPSLNAQKLPVKFKQSETIYILETQMTDEKGKEFDIPQWYKIQCLNGQKGWMPARFVGLPF
jgi:hypothetical protein